MKSIITKLLMLAAVLSTSTNINAYDFMDNNIYYDITSSTERTVTVTGCYYQISVDIPNVVVYNGVPYDVTAIGDYAFHNNDYVMALKISSSVTTIGDFAFSGCSDLKELMFKDGEKARITYIGNSAFNGCSGLTSVTIPNSVTSIGNSAFYNCSGLTSVTIPNGVTTIGDSAFNGCSGLTSVTIPNGVTTIGDSAFNGCSGLTSVTIPESIISIGNEAFRGCSSIESVNISDLSAWCKIDFSNVNSNPLNYAQNLYLKDELIKDLVIPDGVTRVEDMVFLGATCLKSVTIPNSVTTIGDSAFNGCSSLYTVTIPNSVTSIDDYAFRNCDKLYSLIIGSGVSQIGEDAANPIKTIWLPNTPPSGYRNANGKVNYVANDLYTALSNVTVYPFISSLFEVDGVRYVPVVPSERTCDAIDCTYNPEISDFDLGNINYLGITMLVQNIQPYTFYRNAKIQNIIIPQNATSVGDYNFDGCTSLAYVTINDRETELELGSNGSEPLFVSCPLDTVYIGGDISYPTSSGQGYSPFYQNETLEKITIANVENAITEKEFYNCISLKDVSIGDDVEIIGDWAFSGCVVLNNFSFGSSMKEIGEEAFSDCIAMTNIISKATVPPLCGWQALDDINKWNCTLTVPLSAVDSYKAAEQWKEFFFITGEDYDKPGSVGDAVSENGGVSVATYRDSIEIIGADNAMITVYNINGQLVYNGTETTVGGLAQGIYIVCVGGQTFKVAL